MTNAEDEQAVETTTEASAGASRLPAAPYMAGKTFTNMFEKYGSEGLPAVFDISFFNGASGSTVAQTRSSMRFFDLIDDEYVPTQMMRDLVDTDEGTRKSILKDMVEEKYPDALALSMNATSGQLRTVFSDRGLNGQTIDKAIAFYLHLLDYTGIPYSPHFKKRNGGTARRRKPAKQSETPHVVAPVVHKPKMTTAEEQKAAYVQTLLDLAKKDGADADLQDRIFDRIEKALGIGSEPSPTPEGGGHTDSP